MAMPQTRHKDPADCVKVALALNVPIVKSIGLVNDQRMLEEFGRLLIIDERVFEQIFVARAELHGCPCCARSATTVQIASSGRSNSTTPFSSENISVFRQFN